MRPPAEIIRDIETFRPTPEGWLGLDMLLDELFMSPSPGDGVEALLRVFERFPGEDGYGVFWAIVHGLENLPGYEPNLIASVQRRPTEFNVLMVHRLLKSGVRCVGNIDLNVVLDDLLASPDTPAALRMQVLDYLETNPRSPA